MKYQWGLQVCRSAPHSPLPAQVLPLDLSVWLSVVSRLNYLPSASISAYHQTLGLSPCNYLGSVSPWGRISGPGRERMWDKVWLWLGGRHRRPQAEPLPLNHRKHLQYHSRRLSGQVEESIFLECSKRSKRLYLKAILEFSFPSPFTLMYHHLLGWHSHSYATRPGWYAN